MFINFFFENGSVYEIMSKNMEETEATDNMAHARCVLDKWGYTRGHRNL